MTNAILDIHHHGATPRSGAVNSIMAGDRLPEGDYLFSIGVHPWQTDSDEIDSLFASVSNAIADTRVVAIGECGIDRLRGGTVQLQTEIFERHVDLAVQTGKPLIIHNVRASDLIIPALKKAGNSLKPIIHGFRGKPIEAQQLIDAGAYISLGQKFNIETAKIIPDNRLFVETDESATPVNEIVEAIAAARQTNPQKINEQIVLNAELLGI